MKRLMSLNALAAMFTAGPLPQGRSSYHPIWIGPPRSQLGPGRLTKTPGISPKRRAKHALMAAQGITSGRQWRKYRKQVKRDAKVRA